MYLIQFPNITGSPRPTKIQRQLVHEYRPEPKCRDLTHLVLTVLPWVLCLLKLQRMQHAVALMTNLSESL